MNPAAIGGALRPQTGSHDDVFASGRRCANTKRLTSLRSPINWSGSTKIRPSVWPVAWIWGGSVRLDTPSGGNAALEWCRQDRRCRAAVNLDGALWSEVGRVGLDRPALQVLAEHGEFAVAAEDAVKGGAAPTVEWFEAEKAITFGGWRTVQQRAQPG
jgi:hypothetical protein